MKIHHCALLQAHPVVAFLAFIYFLVVFPIERRPLAVRTLLGLRIPQRLKMCFAGLLVRKLLCEFYQVHRLFFLQK